MGKKVQTYFRPYVLAAAVQAKPELIAQCLRHRLPISSKLAYRVKRVFGDAVIFYA